MEGNKVELLSGVKNDRPLPQRMRELEYTMVTQVVAAFIYTMPSSSVWCKAHSGLGHEQAQSQHGGWLLRRATVRRRVLDLCPSATNTVTGICDGLHGFQFPCPYFGQGYDYLIGEDRSPRNRIWLVSSTSQLWSNSFTVKHPSEIPCDPWKRRITLQYRSSGPCCPIWCVQKTWPCQVQ